MKKQNKVETTKQTFPIVPKNIAEAEFLYDPLYQDNRKRPEKVENDEVAIKDKPETI